MGDGDGVFRACTQEGASQALSRVAISDEGKLIQFLGEDRASAVPGPAVAMWMCGWSTSRLAMRAAPGLVSHTQLHVALGAGSLWR